MPQPPRLLLALDFGGTKLSAAITSDNDRMWLDQQRRFTPAGADATYEYRIMLEMAQELVDRAG